MNEALRRTRNARGFTQDYLAHQIGITGRAYRDYEHGKRSPSIWQAYDLADALGVPVEQIFIRNDTTRKQSRPTQIVKTDGTDTERAS